MVQTVQTIFFFFKVTLSRPKSFPRFMVTDLESHKRNGTNKLLFQVACGEILIDIFMLSLQISLLIILETPEYLHEYQQRI